MKKSDKKRKIIFPVLFLLVVVTGIVIWLILYMKPNGERDRRSENSGTIVNKSDQSEKAGEEENAEDWYDLPGYFNGVTREEEQNICGVALPYVVEDTPIVIEGIGQYTGPFVEDGSDEPVANVLAMVIKNDSDTAVEFAELRFSLNDGEEAVFQISTLPAGKSALILEQTKKEFHKEDSLAFAEKMYAKMDDFPLMEDSVEVSAKEGALTVKNLTQESLGTVYVRYKSKLNEQYFLGGITYSCKVENVEAGVSIEEETRHFSVEGSKVLMVQAIQE